MKKQKKKRLVEETYKDLRKAAPEFLDTRIKSDKTPGSIYQGISGNKITCKTQSYTGVGSYIQTIILKDLPALIEKYKGKAKPLEIVRKALQGDILIHCECPAWLYWGYQYKGTEKGYSIKPETRPPVKRNPKLKGATCKHLDATNYTLPFLATVITKDLVKQGEL